MLEEETSVLGCPVVKWPLLTLTAGVASNPSAGGTRFAIVESIYGGAMQTTQARDQIDDPVGHISISGIHGRDELDKRMSTAQHHETDQGSRLGAVLLGAAVGATLMYLLRR